MVDSAAAVFVAQANNLISDFLASEVLPSFNLPGNILYV